METEHVFFRTEAACIGVYTGYATDPDVSVDIRVGYPTSIHPITPYMVLYMPKRMLDHNNTSPYLHAYIKRGYISLTNLINSIFYFPGTRLKKYILVVNTLVQKATSNIVKLNRGWL